jgi:hypothetical protein
MHTHTDLVLGEELLHEDEHILQGLVIDDRVETSREYSG